MKARVTKELVKELLGAPIHFGRPHTPDDEGWIEALIKNLKYHREAPQSFKIVDDVLQWLSRFPDIYNNDPHSSLSYVTPLQALQGQKEVILNQRKQNLEAARALRYTAWKSAYMPPSGSFRSSVATGLRGQTRKKIPPCQHSMHPSSFSFHQESVLLFQNLSLFPPFHPLLPELPFVL